jgi:hypothetical protein
VVDNKIGPVKVVDNKIGPVKVQSLSKISGFDKRGFQILASRFSEIVRRMIAGGRLFNYREYADKMSPLEYAHKVISGELRDQVLSFELANGFRFIKILPNYLDDVRSLNYASFIEWLNLKYNSH